MKTLYISRTLLAFAALTLFSVGAQATVVNGFNQNATDIQCRNSATNTVIPNYSQNCWTAVTDSHPTYRANFEGLENTSNDVILGDDAFGPLLAGLDLLYKAESASTEDADGNPIPAQAAPKDEEGSLKNSYTTSFLFDSNEYHGADISYVPGRPSVDCSITCYLLLKDGNQKPAAYLFNLALGWDSVTRNPTADGGPSWNGTDPLGIKNFWKDAGSISYVALYGNVSAIPVPAAFWLFGTALLGFIGLSRSTRV